MKQSPLRNLLIGGLSVGLTVLAAVWGQRPTQTDIGDLDKEAVKGAFKKPYSPYAGRTYPMRPLFGDTHLHTSASMDAGAFGCRLGPRDAYRFARGEEVVASMGERARLARPLDFLVVTDHSDGLGFFPQLLAGDPAILADPKGRKWFNMIREGHGADAAVDIVSSFTQGTFPKAITPLPGTPAYRKAWRDIIAAADEANEPHRFRVAFAGVRMTPH